MRLLRCLLEKRGAQLPPPLDQRMLLQQLPPPDTVTGSNWPEMLRQVAWLCGDMLEAEGGRAALTELAAGGYEALPLSSRVLLLRALCDACTSTEEIHEALRRHDEKQQEPVNESCE